MTLRNLRIVALTITGTLMVAGVDAAEKKIARAQLPPAVEKTVAAQSKNATIKGLLTDVDHGQTIYEVELALDGHSRDVTVDERGNILEVEEEVSLASLPPAVRDGLTKSAGSGTIGKVESLTKKGTLVAYEAVVQKGKKHTEIQVGPDGKKLAQPQ